MPPLQTRLHDDRVVGWIEDGVRRTLTEESMFKLGVIAIAILLTAMPDLLLGHLGVDQHFGPFERAARRRWHSWKIAVFGQV